MTHVWRDGKWSVHHTNDLMFPGRKPRLFVASDQALWYWGDQHYDITVGPERANGLEPCASALREGVSFSIHSDAGVNYGEQQGEVLEGQIEQAKLPTASGSDAPHARKARRH